MNDLKTRIRKVLDAYSKGHVSAEHACMAVALALSEADAPTVNAEPLDDATAKRIALARERLPPMIVDFIDAVASIARDGGK